MATIELLAMAIINGLAQEGKSCFKKFNDQVAQQYEYDMAMLEPLESSGEGNQLCRITRGVRTPQRIDQESC
jgi:hypothetical protein